MRKLTLILTLLLLFSGIAVAEEIDLDSMSMTELVKLELDVQKKILELDPYSKLVFYPGEYIVGEDFEPGNYLITPIENSDTKWDKDYYIAYIYLTKEDREAYKLAYAREYHMDSPQKISFEYGNCIVLEKAVFALIRV